MESFQNRMTPEGDEILAKILSGANAEGSSFDHGFRLGARCAKEMARTDYSAAELMCGRRIRCLMERNNRLGLICFVQGLAMAAGLVWWIYQELVR